MRIISARILFTAAIVLFLGLLVANKAMVRAHAAGTTATSCQKAADSVHKKSMASGFSEPGATSQAENFMARCLIDG